MFSENFSDPVAGQARPLWHPGGDGPGRGRQAPPQTAGLHREEGLCGRHGPAGCQ